MLALLAALSFAAAPSCGLPPLRNGPLPFAPGELLAYDVDVLGVVRAGTLTVGVEPPISRGVFARSAPAETLSPSSTSMWAFSGIE